ncbi:sulfotransferase [Cryomorphaceae bacterium 1068]|nr:sulfotransferase [Cryomorphaceae bacterium 1068]
MLIDINGQDLNLPDILILGAAKSGTTSLAFFLKQHPDVFMPRKEPGFFAYHDRDVSEIPSGIRDRQIVDLKEYTDMYAPVGKGQKICDSSVAQFTNHKDTLRNIKALYGEKTKELKTFIILRNPVDRSFSHYLMFVKNQLEDLDFKEALAPEIVEQRRKEQLGFDYIGGSLYAERIKDILEELPQTVVYITSDLKRSELLEEFLTACDLRVDVDINTKARLNPSGLPKRKGLISALNHQNPLKAFMKKALPGKALFKLYALKSKLMEKGIERVELDPVVRMELTEKYFKSDIQELEKILNRDLSKWYAAIEKPKA